MVRAQLKLVVLGRFGVQLGALAFRVQDSWCLGQWALQQTWGDCCNGGAEKGLRVQSLPAKQAYHYDLRIWSLKNARLLSGPDHLQRR